MISWSSFKTTGGFDRVDQALPRGDLKNDAVNASDQTVQRDRLKILVDQDS